MEKMIRHTDAELSGFGGGIRHIWKNITYGYKQFLCFFIALFVCQSFCWILILSNGVNNRHVYDTVLSRYDYHFSLSLSSGSDATLLSNAIGSANEQGMGYGVRVERKNQEYVFYVTVGTPEIATRNTEQKYEAFLSVVIPLSGISGASSDPEELLAAGLIPEKSPLMTCKQEYVLPNNILTVCIVAPLAVVSILLLMFLYQIRLNDRKFMFGIYMAFGADFKRLFRTAVGELLLLSALTLIPSGVFSFAAVLLLYLPKGIALAFPVWEILLFLIFNFLIVFLSVYLPMKHLSLRAPVELIASTDNAGLVSSPRRSFRIFGKTFPKHYELFGVFRFRTHHIKLVLTATLFVACFVCGFYLCRMYGEIRSGAVKEYVVSVPGYLDAEDAVSDSEAFISELKEIPGVSHAYWEVKSPATAHRNFMMLQAENGRGAVEYTVNTQTIVNTEEYTKAKYEQYVEEGFVSATNSFAYTALNAQMIDYLCEAYTVEGDPYAILEKENYIILGESLYNASVFRFSPGDQILLCEIVSGTLPDHLIYPDDQVILTEQLKISGIRFHVYTVAAVVRGDPAENHFFAGVSASDFKRFTGEEAKPSEISLYVENGLSFEELDALDAKVSDAMALYTDVGYAVVPTGEYLSVKLREDKQSTARTVIWSCLILTLSPLLWFFSQTLFFGKREKEFRILRAFGAFEEDIRGIHVWSGILLGGAAAVITLLEGILCNYLLYAFCNYFLTRIGVLMDVRYSFSIPVLALILAILASATFGFLSSYVPFLSYRKAAAAAVVKADAADSSEQKRSEN